MNKLVRYALGIVLPPVGVFLTYGISSAFFISLALTFLGWMLPGSIHADMGDRQALRKCSVDWRLYRNQPSPNE